MFFASKLSENIRMFGSELVADAVAFGQGMGVNISTSGYRDRRSRVPSYSFYAPTEKVPATGPINKKKDYTMFLAKNEREYCQIAFRLKTGLRESTIKLSEFKDADGNILESEFCEVHYMPTPGVTPNGISPDALIPLAERSKYMECGPQINYVFFIGVRASKDTKAGDYTATVSFESTQNDYPYAIVPPADKIKATVKAHVWDFTLPDAPSMDSAMGLDKKQLARAYRVDEESDEAQRLYDEYYAFLLDHRINPYLLPYDVLDERADAYMDDPRCRCFCIPRGDDDYIRKVYEKLSAHPKWKEKAYFYLIDEPNDEKAYAKYAAIVERLNRLYPGYHMVTPFCTNDLTVNGEKTTSVSLQDGKSDIICPQSNFCAEKEALAEMKKRQARGDRLWWYVCCNPKPTTDFCNLFVQFDGLKHRILFWQQKQLGITGLLYWDTNYWDGVSDIWSSVWTAPWTGYDTFGDGSLFYHGYHLGRGPVSCLRLEAVANGMEDYEYLVMAEKLLGPKYVENTIAKICANLTEYSYSDEKFAKTRIELGYAIEKASKQLHLSGR